ncbi:MAG: hypothetical protein ACYCR2_05765 [Thermoplasmataceae archaeon]
MSIENFRCHKGSKIEFFKEGNNRRISIIEGGDGAGKTSIFNAIGWCLYGIETSELLGEPAQSLGVPNISLSSSEVIDHLSVELWIEFENIGQGTTAPISARALRTSNFRGNRIIDQDFLLELYYEAKSPEILRGSEAEKYIDDLIPKDLIEFYMFNGEYLSSGRNVKGENIDASIKRQFKTGAINSMERLLEAVEDEYRRSATRAARKNNTTLIQKIEDNEKLITENEDGKTKWENDFRLYQEKAVGAKQKMETLREKKTRVEAKREVLATLSSKKEDYRKISSDLKEKYSQLHRLQYNSLYLLLSKSTNERIYGLIKEEIGHANLPPKIKKEFISDLLNQHKCICGRSLEESTHEYEVVKDLILDSEKDSKKTILLELSPQVRYIASNKVESCILQLKTIQENILELLEEQRKSNEEIEEIRNMEHSLSEEETSVIEEFENAEKDFRHFSALSNEAERNLKETEKRIESLKKENMDLKEQQAKIIGKAEEAVKFQKFEKLSMELRTIISSLRERISVMFIGALQSEINYLISMVKGMSHLSVKIQNFGNSVKVTYEDKYLPLKGVSYLSEGQNQIISIALIAAYISVLKKLGGGIAQVPFVVMDHPFSDLGLPRKEEILKSFDFLFSGTKVIILTPPGDFNLTPIANMVSSHYVVNNDPQEKICNVLEDPL